MNIRFAMVEGNITEIEIELILIMEITQILILEFE
jgi:hypothetical protein